MQQKIIKFFEPPIDITVIEIIEDDKIPEKKFLYPDLNYKHGYSFYLGQNCCLAGYPKNENNEGERCISSGEIKKVNDLEFIHSMDTRSGSSGSPICLLDKNMCVIGVHKEGDKINKANHGTFIGYILNIFEQPITK